jgi:hypothetical protein
MKSTNLVPIAAKFAKTHPAEIFRIAVSIYKKDWNTKDTMVEYKLQTGRGFFDEWVQDCALDILAGRIPLWLTLPEDGDVWVVRPLAHLLTAELWRDGNDGPDDQYEERW